MDEFVDVFEHVLTACFVYFAGKDSDFGVIFAVFANVGLLCKQGLHIRTLFFQFFQVLFNVVKLDKSRFI